MKEEILKQPIEVLDLSLRTFNCLKLLGVKTIEDVLHFHEDKSLFKSKYFSRKVYKELISKLMSLNIVTESWIDQDVVKTRHYDMDYLLGKKEYWVR